MTNTALTIAIRDTHRRQYRRTIRRAFFGWLVLSFAALTLAANAGGERALLPTAVMMFVGFIAFRIWLWVRYRRDMRAELAHAMATGGSGD